MIITAIIVTIITSITNLIIAYATYFMQMGMIFSVTFLLKRLFTSCGDKQKGDMIAMGGYSLTIAIFFCFLSAIVGDFKGTPVTDPNYIQNVVDSLPTFLK